MVKIEGEPLRGEGISVEKLAQTIFLGDFSIRVSANSNMLRVFHKNAKGASTVAHIYPEEKRMELYNPLYAVKARTFAQAYEDIFMNSGEEFIIQR